MAVTATPALPQTPKSWKAQILPADASALKTIVTGGANGSKVTAVIATSSDTSARVVTIGITNASIFYPLCTVNMPITAGNATGVPAVNLLDPLVCAGLPVDNDGQPYILLTSASDTLQARSGTTVTAAKDISFNAFGADF